MTTEVDLSDYLAVPEDVISIPFTSAGHKQVEHWNATQDVRNDVRTHP
jgi:hypothetical protein